MELYFDLSQEKQCSSMLHFYSVLLPAALPFLCDSRWPVVWAIDTVCADGWTFNDAVCLQS